MNCNNLRERLDCMIAEERAADVEVTAHLEACAGCREFVAQTEVFDQRVSSLLKIVPAADGLLERLLAEVIEDSKAPSEQLPIAKRIRNSRPFVIINRVVVTSLAVAVIFAVSSLWSPEVVQTPFDYTAAKSELTETFSHITNETWSDFAAFDGTSFQVQRLDSFVRKWNLTDPVGFDLGNDVAHDVAAFQFAYQKSAQRKWSGTLLVMPTSKFEGTPEGSLPSPLSGIQVLEWQSANGELTYLCFVETGSADELANAMLGNLS